MDVISGEWIRRRYSDQQKHPSAARPHAILCLSLALDRKHQERSNSPKPVRPSWAPRRVRVSCVVRTGEYPNRGCTNWIDIEIDIEVEVSPHTCSSACGRATDNATILEGEACSPNVIPSGIFFIVSFTAAIAAVLGFVGGFRGSWPTSKHCVARASRCQTGAARSLSTPSRSAQLSYCTHVRSRSSSSGPAPVSLYPIQYPSGWSIEMPISFAPKEWHATRCQ